LIALAWRWLNLVIGSGSGAVMVGVACGAGSEVATSSFSTFPSLGLNRQ